MRSALHALAFTVAARRDCARTTVACLASSQVHRSRPPSSTTTILGSTGSFSSRSFERCAARAVRPPLTRTRSPAARSYPPRSAAANHRLAAVERVFVSPCSPSHLLSCAGRSNYVMSNTLTRQRPPSAPQTARSASRTCVVRSRAHARDRVPREGAAVRARCARCAWRVAAILGAVVAWEARRARWCAARRARWRCWRARSRGARFARAMPAGRRVRMGVLAGSWCRVGYC